MILVGLLQLEIESMLRMASSVEFHSLNAHGELRRTLKMCIWNKDRADLL